MNLFQTKYKYLLAGLFLLVMFVLIYVYATSKNTENGQIASYNFTKSEYTYVSENFYYECKIIVNVVDEATKEKQNINKEYVSMNYTFDIVPKDKNVTFYDFKVDATLDSEIIAMHLAPFENVIKSYGNDDKAPGADIGHGMPSFALSIGSLVFMDLETFNTIKENPEVLKKAINFDITWKGGHESIELPNDNVNVIIND